MKSTSSKKPKLLFLKAFLAQRTNGAEIGNLERLLFLQNAGWEIKIHSAISDTSQKWAADFLNQEGTPFDPQTSSYKIDGILTEVAFGKDFHDENVKSEGPMLDHFAKVIAQEKPDYIWTNYYDYYAVSASLIWNPARAWVDVSDNQIPRLAAFEKLQVLSQVRDAYLQTRTLMVASPFMERVCQRDFPHHIRVIEVPNPMSNLKSSKRMEWSPDKPWLFVNPTEVKGLAFVLELCKALPDQKFLFVLNWTDNRIPPGLPENVRCVPRQKSLDSVFQKVKGILVPSVVEEGLGRVALEAMASRVPVISSNRGALPETLADGGICLPLEVSQWSEVLRNSDLSYWSALTDNGILRIEKYQTLAQTKLAAIEKEMSEALQ